MIDAKTVPDCQYAELSKRVTGFGWNHRIIDITPFIFESDIPPSITMTGKSVQLVAVSHNEIQATPTGYRKPLVIAMAPCAGVGSGQRCIPHLEWRVSETQRIIKAHFVKQSGRHTVQQIPPVPILVSVVFLPEKDIIKQAAVKSVGLDTC